MSKNKFEECSLHNATHFEINGIRHDLLDNAQYSYNGTCAGIRWREEDVFVPEELFSTFGIKPLKKVKPKPIEFEATFAKYDGNWYPLHCLDDGVSYLHNKKARFRCVEILEDEE